LQSCYLASPYAVHRLAYKNAPLLFLGDKYQDFLFL